MKSFYEQWSTKYLGNLVISHLINKNCVRMCLYCGTEAGTGQEGCLLKETVLKNNLPSAVTGTILVLLQVMMWFSWQIM